MKLELSLSVVCHYSTFHTRCFVCSPTYGDEKVSCYSYCYSTHEPYQPTCRICTVIGGLRATLSRSMHRLHHAALPNSILWVESGWWQWVVQEVWYKCNAQHWGGVPRACYSKRLLDLFFILFMHFLYLCCDSLFQVLQL